MRMTKPANSEYFCGVLYKKHHKHLWKFLWLNSSRSHAYKEQSQRLYSANSDRIISLPMSHQKSIFMLTKKQVPRIRRNFSFCCVCLTACCSLSSLKHTSSHDKKHTYSNFQWTAHSCCVLLQLALTATTQAAADLVARRCTILNCQSPSYSNDLFTHQNVLDAPVFFEKSTSGISDRLNCSSALKNLLDL